MGRRFHITIDAKTSVGGKVISASHFASVDGRQLAVEGDSIRCPVCKSIGSIHCIGPRIPSTIDGKECALSGDICICKCNPPPTLIAIQEQLSQLVDADSDGDSGSTYHQGTNSAHDNTHDLTFEVKNLDGDVLSGHPYLIELSDGTRLEGVTDDDGMTQIISSMEPQTARLTVYAPEPTPLNPNWDREL